jgi:hypothetical protein
VIDGGGDGSSTGPAWLTVSDTAYTGYDPEGNVKAYPITGRR